MTRDDLFNKNASVVAGIAKVCASACPAARCLIISNPVNSMVPIFVEILKKVSTGSVCIHTCFRHICTILVPFGIGAVHLSTSSKISLCMLQTYCSNALCVSLIHLSFFRNVRKVSMTHER